jgi:small subunit ribosomal protein S21
VERESSGERKEVYRLEIKVNGNDIERALKLLKRQLQKDGLLKELKKRRYYEKPSVKIKSKQREAQKRRVKSARQSRQNRSVN